MSANESKSADREKPLNPIAEVAEQVGREILESRMEPGAWATALHECGGKRQEALALYAKIRIRKLTKQRRVRLAKQRSLEHRRINNCMGDAQTRESLAKTVQEMLMRTRGAKSGNFVKPKISPVWLAVLFVGSAGTAAALLRLYQRFLPDFLANPQILVAMLVGVGTVWSALVLRYFLPKRWIMLGWNTGIVFACNLLCLCSLFLGTKIIKKAVASDAVAFPPPAAVSNQTAAKKSEQPEKNRLVSNRITADPLPAN